MATCQSARIVDDERVQCQKTFGHPGVWHYAVIPDLSVIHWSGAPSRDVPIQRSPCGHYPCDICEMEVVP